MRGFAKENKLLLGVMLVSATAVLSYFPFLTTNLGDFTGIRSDYIPLILATGIITGNALAYLTSLAAKDRHFVALLKSAYALASLSILLLVLCKGARLPVAVAFVAVSAFMYRYSISLAGNVVRALHLDYLPEGGSRTQLFSYIKFFTSIGGAVGPVLGTLMLRTSGFGGIVLLSSALFGGCFAMLLQLKRAEKPKVRPSLNAYRTLLAQPPALYAISIAAMLHYIFEAQIFTAIPANIKHNTERFGDLISAMFVCNSAILLLCTIPLLRYLAKFSRPLSVASLGTLLSLTAVVCSYFVHGLTGVVLVTALFSIGEIITPQITIDLATSHTHSENSLGAVATYNLFTLAIGMGLGFGIGGFVSYGVGFKWSALIWTGVYVLYLAFIAVYRMLNATTAATHPVEASRSV